VFHHVKELQFNARVSRPDPRFATMLLEQFGGPNGELKAAMQYFVQAFVCRQPYPDKYDMLMDIATEEFSHLEIVGATITMLLDGINGELKNAVEKTDLMKLVSGKTGKEEVMHQAMLTPTFLVLSGGGPTVTNSEGEPWSGMYVNANGDLTVDLRSNIAAESRAKIVYEYLTQFTDDPLVLESLRFLMTREIAHFQQFTAALETISPNFPPGILQGDPRFTHRYFNLSEGQNARGPWNEGQGPWRPGESWDYVADPLGHVTATEGLVEDKPVGGKLTESDVQKMNAELSQLRSAEVKAAMPKGEKVWSTYGNGGGEAPVTGQAAGLSEPAARRARSAGAGSRAATSAQDDPTAPKGSKSAPGSQNRK
jgi:Mn-containing catalase